MNIFLFAALFLAVLAVTGCFFHPLSPDELFEYDPNDPGAGGVFSRGRGTEEDPYIITTSAQMFQFAESVNSGNPYQGKFIALGADIDLGNREWTPIGMDRYRFKGTFDGRMHSVSRLSIQSAKNTDKLGLFGHVDGGTIKNVVVKSGNINHNGEIGQFGGIVGWIENGRVISCGNEGVEIVEIWESFNTHHIGGVVGHGKDSVIYNSYNTAFVSGPDPMCTGGIGGVFENTEMYNCYNRGNVSSFAGGLFGNSTGTSVAAYSYYLDSCAQNHCGVQGYWVTAILPENCGTFSDAGMVGQDRLVDLLNEWVDTQPNSAAYYKWENGLTDGYPVFSKSTGTAVPGSWRYPSEPFTPAWLGIGTQDRPYIITTAQELADFAYLVNKGVFVDDTNYRYKQKYFALGADITLNSETMPTLNKWTPIGADRDSSFQGTFDGRGYTINGLCVDGEYEYAGLFGYVEGGTIKNVILGTGSVSVIGTNGDKSCVGAVVGYLMSSPAMIDSCGNEGTAVSATGSYSVYAGGIVGRMDGGFVQNSYNQAELNSSQYGGGIVGYMDGDSSVQNAYNEGTVSAESISCIVYAGGIVGGMNNGSVQDSCNEGAVSAYDGAGGIVGHMNNGSVHCSSNYVTVSANVNAGGIVGNMDSGSVQDSCNEGAVSAYDGAGGIVGNMNGGFVQNSYNHGSVTVSDFYRYSGGIVGYAYYGSNSTIENCYNTGDLKGTYRGGILGYDNGYRDYIQVRNCYYLDGCNATDVCGYNNRETTCCDSFSSVSSDISNGYIPSGKLLENLNAWVDDQRVPSTYQSWTTDSGGYPVLDFTTLAD